MGKGTRRTTEAAAGKTQLPAPDEKGLQQAAERLGRAEAAHAAAAAAWHEVDIRRRRARSVLREELRDAETLLALPARNARQEARLALLQARRGAREAALAILVRESERALEQRRKRREELNTAQLRHHQLQLQNERTGGNAVYGGVRNGYISLAALCLDLPLAAAKMPLTSLRFTNRSKHRVWVAPRPRWHRTPELEPLQCTLGELARAWLNGRVDQISIRKNEPSTRYLRPRAVRFDGLLVEVDDSGLPRLGALEVGTSPFIQQVLAQMAPSLKGRLSVGKLYGWPRLVHYGYDLARRVGFTTEIDAMALTLTEVERRLPAYDRDGPHFQHVVPEQWTSQAGPKLDRQLAAPIASLEPDL